MSDRILRNKEVVHLTGISTTTRNELEASGNFPKRRQITERIIGYSFLEVQEWINDRLHGGEV